MEGAVYKGRPANGEGLYTRYPIVARRASKGILHTRGGGGGGFEISDIPAGRGEGGVVCESSDVRKFLKKIDIPKFIRAL